MTEDLGRILHGPLRDTHGRDPEERMRLCSLLGPEHAIARHQHSVLPNG